MAVTSTRREGIDVSQWSAYFEPQPVQRTQRGRTIFQSGVDRGAAGRHNCAQGINMAPSQYLHGALAVFCVTLTCNGFNIDSRFPVIKEGKTKGSFFGFAVALHKQTEGSTKYL